MDGWPGSTGAGAGPPTVGATGAIPRVDPMQYVVVRRLGRGGMGVVDLATAPDGTEVALKRLSLHGTPDEVARARARIRREAEVLGSLDHPGIVRLLDVVDDGDDVVLVMPYLPGGSLHERVTTGGPLAPEAVQALADRLLDALAAAHRQGIVHRDIKPENVLFAADGDPRLVDFGVARATDHTIGLTATSMVVGTPGFMAPEQARGEEAGAASDVFSLGATLLFALTGEGPFGPIAADPRVLMHRAATGRVERVPKELPPELRTLLVGALDPRADRRPSAALLRGGPGGTTPRTRLSGAVTGRRLLAVGGVALLLALVLGVGVAALLGGDDDGDASGPTTTGARPTTEPETTTTSTTEPCVSLRYQLCEGGVLGEPRPGTDGEECLPGFEDYDGDRTNGCEAEEDGLDEPAVLTEDDEEIEATIVPGDDVDRFVLPADDGFSLTCDGEITVSLTAPEGMALRMVVIRSDGNTAADVIAAGGETVEAGVGERCGSTDGDLAVEISPVGSDRSGEPYTLRRSGGF